MTQPYTGYTHKEVAVKRELHDVRVQIVAPQSWLQMVETWRKNHPENISRSEAIRIMTERAFQQPAA